MQNKTMPLLSGLFTDRELGLNHGHPWAKAWSSTRMNKETKLQARRDASSTRYWSPSFMMRSSTNFWTCSTNLNKRLSY